MKKAVSLLMLLLHMVAFSQNNFVKDPSFNTFTLAQDQYYIDTPKISHSLVQPDGQMIYAINSHLNPQVSRLVRLNNNIKDNGFYTGVFNGLILDMLLQPDGKIVICGEFTTYDGVSAKYLIRLNADGTRDTGFNMGTGFLLNIFSNYYVRSLALLPNGQIYVGGDFQQYNGIIRNNMVRLNANGTLDTSFTAEIPQMHDNHISAMAVQADGKIVIARTDVLERLLPNGDYDDSFFYYPATSPGNLVTFSGGSESNVSKLIIRSDGKIWVGGKFAAAFNTNRKDLALVNADGTLDTSVPSMSFVSSSNYKGLTALYMQEDGKLLVSGQYYNPNGQISKGLIRLNPQTLQVDPSFTGYIHNADLNCVYSIRKHPDGNLICSGDFLLYNNEAANDVVKITPDGALVPGFKNICRGFDGAPTKVVEQPDGKLLVSGDFYSYNGVTRVKILRLHTDGSLDNSFMTDTNSLMYQHGYVEDMKLQPDGKIILITRSPFNNNNGVPIIRLNADGTLDTAFAINPNVRTEELEGGGFSLHLQADGKILAAGNFTVNNVGIGHVIRLNADGTRDLSFTITSPFNVIKTMLVQPDEKILLSGIMLSAANSSLRRYTSAGVLDDTFVNPVNTPVFVDFFLTPDNKMLTFYDSSGHQKKRINANGTPDSSFVFPSMTPTYSYFGATAFQPGTDKMIFGFRPGTYTKGLVRVNNNGSIDNSFSIGEGFGIGEGLDTRGFTDHISVIEFDSQGKMLVGGAFNTFNGQIDKSFVRLMDPALLGVEDHVAEDAYVFPNPATDLLHLYAVKEDSIQSLAVYSLSGQKLSSTTNSKSINVSALRAGMYILQAQTTNGKIVRKFIKK